jgi:hypothetical protein
VPIPTPAVAVANADIVFEGVAVQVRDTITTQVGLGGKPSKFRQRIYTVVVSRRWRGVVQDTLEFVTGGGGGDCGYSFDLGQPYLIFPDSSGGPLTVSSCSDTKPSELAAEEIRLLRKREGRSPPVPPNP